MRQKETQGSRILNSCCSVALPLPTLRIILKSQQILLLPHFHAFTNTVLFAANNQLLLIHSNSLALLTAASAVGKVCLPHNYYV